MPRHILASLLVLLVALSAPVGGVRASDGDAPRPEADREIQPRPAVEWKDDWQGGTLFEGILGIGVLAFATQVLNRVARNPTARWDDETTLPLDEEARDYFGADRISEIDIAKITSDIPFFLLAVYPTIIDPIFVAWFGHDAGEVALNTLTINLYSMTWTTFLSLSLQWSTGRERPPYPDGLCEPLSDNPDTEVPCERGAVSFPSGHAATMFAGAGLVCVTHEQIPLYGGGFWDTFACSASVTSASVATIGRLVSHDHWLSDIVIGATLGWSFGYVVPKVFHYGFGDDDDDGEAASLPMIFPTFTEERRMLSLGMQF